MTVDLSNKFSPRQSLWKDTENATGSMDRNHSCKSATFSTQKKNQLIDNNYTYSNLQFKFMEAVKLELIYNGHHICYHLQLMNMDSHITHIHISIIWLKASEKTISFMYITQDLDHYQMIRNGMTSYS